MNAAASPSARISSPRPQAWWAYALPIACSAAMLVLCFPRAGWWWLAFVALGPAFWVAARGRRGRRVVVTGSVVFAAWWLAQARWLMSVGVGPWLGAGIAEGIAFGLGLGAVWLLCHRARLPITLAAALGWSVMDLTRSYQPFGGFSWFSLGHTQAGFTGGGGASWIAQTADLFGEHFVGLLVALANGLVVDLCLRKRRAVRVAVPAAVVLVAAAGYGYWRVAQTASHTTPGPRLAVVQTSFPLDNRKPYSYEDHTARWRQVTALVADAAAQRPDVIVLPESTVVDPINVEAVAHFSPRHWPFPADSRLRLSELARAADANLLVGGAAHFEWTAVRDDAGRHVRDDPKRKRNRIYHLYRDGQYSPATYDKMHLVPFGETIPGATAIPFIKTIVLDWFSPWDFDHSVDPGDARYHFEMPYTDADAEPRVAQLVTPICFEDTIARHCRRLVYRTGPRKSDVLVNQTNDGWFWFGARREVSEEHPDGTAYRPTAQNLQHLQLASMRSIENRVPTARAVNTGVSGFVDSVGRVGPLVTVDGKRQLVAGVAAHRVQVDQRHSLYGRWGNVPMWVLGAGVYAMLGFGFVRPWLLDR